MAGYNTKMEFEEFVKSKKGEKYYLTSEDWKAWNSKKENITKLSRIRGK